jgi:hypothetical protein
VGYDDGRKVKGRTIHALVDTDGLPMRVVVHSAAIEDRDGAGLVLDKIHRRSPWLELIWADGGYNAWQVEAADCRAHGESANGGTRSKLRRARITMIGGQVARAHNAVLRAPLDEFERNIDLKRAVGLPERP